MPRPSIRTRELEAEVLRRMSDGEPLTWICKDIGFHHTTWREWCRADETLNIAHAHAREAGFDAIAEKTLEIADDATNDYMDRQRGEETDRVLDAEHVQRSKLRIETRLKLLAKWDPKRYGDKLGLEHSGNIGIGERLRRAEERLRDAD